MPPRGTATSRRPEDEPEIDEQALLEAARRSAAAAYCPYSGYPVGAAVLTEDGRLFSGANVENAAYGSTVCAERVAIWTSVAAGARQIVALAVVSPSASPPCGPCRQVLAEFAGASAPVICGQLDAAADPGENRVGSAAADRPERRPRRHTLGELLPEPFTAGDL